MEKDNGVSIYLDPTKVIIRTQGQVDFWILDDSPINHGSRIPEG
jgi:hypothetical protein